MVRGGKLRRTRRHDAEIGLDDDAEHMVSSRALGSGLRVGAVLAITLVSLIGLLLNRRPALKVVESGNMKDQAFTPSALRNQDVQPMVKDTSIGLVEDILGRPIPEFPRGISTFEEKPEEPELETTSEQGLDLTDKENISITIVTENPADSEEGDQDNTQPASDQSPSSGEISESSMREMATASGASGQQRKNSSSDSKTISNLSTPTNKEPSALNSGLGESLTTHISSDEEWKGVPLPPINNLNVEFISYMLARIISGHSILTMADMPCSKNAEWMKVLLPRLISENLGFQYVCIETSESAAESMRKQYKNEDYVTVINIKPWIERFPRVDLVFSVGYLQFLDPTKTWRSFKNMKEGGVKFVMFENHIGQGNSNMMLGQRGVMNVRRAPFHFSQPMRVVNNISTGDSDMEVQLVFYAIDALRKGI